MAIGLPVQNLDETSGFPLVVTAPFTGIFWLTGDITISPQSGMSGSTAPNTLYVKGEPVDIVAVPGGYVGVCNGETVFELTTNPNTGEVSYTYTQFLPFDHNDPNNPNDNIHVQLGFTLSDNYGTAMNTFVNLDVADDGVVAVSDELNMSEHASQSGNLLDNDDLSNDGNHITEITFAGTPVAVPSSGTVTVQGAYGVLTVAADGAYTYTPLTNDPLGTDTFSYKLVDGDGDHSLSTAIFHVTPVNDAPAIALANKIESLPENHDTSIPTKIADIVVSDDTLGVNALTLEGANADLFEIVGSELFLKAGVSLDHETLNQLDISVRVGDPALGGAGAVVSMVLPVTDVNEAPTEVGIASPVLFSTFSSSANPAVSVDENAANGTVVGLPWAVDPDFGDTLHFELLDDANGRFSLNENDELVVAAGSALNFENDQFHFITLRATDSGGHSITQNFQIDVNDVNEDPISISLTASSVFEHAANGTLVGTLSSLDPDAGDVLGYTLTDDAGGRFVLDGDKIRVADGLGLDFEQSASHTISVEVTDIGGLKRTQTFSISLADVGTEVVTGDARANKFVGGAGNDRFDGGLGADTLIGGLGNDTYVTDGLDAITELAGGGTDTVVTSVSYNLGANVENLTFTGTGAVNGLGNGLSNVLRGNDAANILNGNGGSDTMVGGLGNDIYVTDGGDAIIESLNGGTDAVYSSVTHALAANIEKLALTGTSHINGTGNSLANIITGNAGNNTLYGGYGIDSLLGGAGNDTYVLSVDKDYVSEGVGSGTDTVLSAFTYTLGANVENLTLTGSTAINGGGNTLNNFVTGNAGVNVLSGGAGNDGLSGGSGNDTLIGGTGRDVLTGGAGRDVFDFNVLTETGKTAATRDFIADFTRGADRLDVSTLDANPKTPGNQAFNFVAAKAFSGVAGQLHYKHINPAGTVNDRTIVEGDVNGDKIADFQIELKGIINLTAPDFIL
jgi:Ca2+-binding RTX toxin-like protein